MSVSANSDLTSANTNAGFMDKNTDTFTVGKVDFQETTDATSTTSASVKTAGGLGVAKKAYLQQAFIPSLSGQFVLTSSATKEVVESGVTDVEIEYVSGVTGPIQTQLDSKATDANVVHKTGNETIAGVKTFSDDTNLQGDVVIDGDLTVNGTTTTVNSATLDVTDTNITVNNLGNDATAEGAGLTVDRTGTSGSFIYEDALGSKWKAGALASESEIITASPAQTMTGTKTFNKVVISQELNLVETIDTTSTGADALVPLTSPTVRLTDAGLTSIGNFDDAFNGKQCTITNDTGASIIIRNDSTGTAIKRILTGTGADMTLADQATIIISYNSNKTRWQVIGGSGSGSAPVPVYWRYSLAAATLLTALTAIEFDTMEYESHPGYYTMIGGGFEIPPGQDGIYHIDLKVYTASAQYANIYLNGSLISQGDHSDSTTPAIVSDTFKLIAGDVLDMRPVVTGTSAAGPVYTTVAITKVSEI